MSEVKINFRKSWLLFFILFGTMFLFGYIENIKGVSFPLIKAEFAVSYAHQGLMLSIKSLGYTVFCVVGGILLGSIGVKKALIMGFSLIIAGLIGISFMPRFMLVAGTLFLIAASFGLFSVSLNALASQVFTFRTALLMSLMNFFYGAGSSVSPRVSGVIASTMDWRQAYLFSVLLVLAFFIPSIFTRFPQAEGEEKKKTSFLTAIKTPMAWVFGIILGLCVAVEMWSPNWAALYFRDVFQLDPTTSGARYISNFFILFTISRLVSGFAIEKIGYLRSLFVTVLASLAIFIVGLFLGARAIHVLPAFGFFKAMFWPVTLAMAMVYFRKNAPVMISAVIVIHGAFNAIMQLMIGVITRSAGPAWSYYTCLILTVILVICLIILARFMQRGTSALGPGADSQKGAFT